MRGVVASIGLLLGAAEAHVSMVYKDGQVGSIRNANNPTGNGQASVQTNCGGATQFGSNGVGTLQDGATVTYSMRYAAGHNGAFRMAYACNTQDGTQLEADAARLTDCTVTGAGGAYGAGQAGGATATGQNPMDITCVLPEQGNAAPQDCVIGILDQRDWGGCIDINLVPAAAPLPPNPPPAPFVSSAGYYALLNTREIDTSAGTTSAGTFSCCALSSGALVIPPYQEGQATVQATFENAKATGCYATPPDTSQAPPSANAEVTVSAQAFTMVVSDGGNKYKGQKAIANQIFDVEVASGVMSFVNTYTDANTQVGNQQPIVCDGTSELGLALAGDSSGSSMTTAIAVVFVLLVAVGGYFYMKKKKAAAAGGGKAPTFTTSSASSAPPPPPAAGALPPEWQEMKDPNTGTAYYYNSQTGESVWTRPGARV